MAGALGLSVLDWSPLGGGALTGKFLDGGGGRAEETRLGSGVVGHFDKYRTPRAAAIARAVVDAAAEVGCSPAQLALAWLRHRSPLHIPIVGARTVRHLRDNLGAVEVAVPAEIAARLDAASAIEPSFPADFYRNGWRDWFGPHLERLDPRVRPLGREALGLDAGGARP